MTVTAIDRCLSLIETLAGEPEALELSVIASRIGTPNSAAHRILTTLMARGWVVQDPASQNYALSLRLSTLAFRNLDTRAVPDLVQSVLDGLARRTREYCRLAIVEGEDLVWVARAQGATAGLRYDPDMGQEIVLHATANGKAWLATLPENEALRIVCGRGFEAHRPLGPNSIKTVDELRQHLDDTRANGYAIAVDEAEPGTAAIAVPFHCDDVPGAPIAGTISVAGPRLRIGPDRYEELGRDLRASAREIAAVWPLRARQRHAGSNGGWTARETEPVS
ncbi:MAG: IclR family transcriptional regulator [Hyphomicrobiales bacterium]|nr:IclR family transcriptional regulator [Hyphomicrobiales bacterium]